MKQISPQAYTSLRNALPTISWYKNDFETYIRAAFGSYPEIISKLNFSSPKRESSDIIISELVNNQRRYQNVTIELILDIAAMEEFPLLKKIKDEKDRRIRIDKATEAVEELRTMTQGLATEAERERKKALARERAAESAKIQAKFTEDLKNLHNRFIELHTGGKNPQVRGLELESLLNDLFELFDLTPRISYTGNHEQIDGSIHFDSDDYIVEAKWLAKPVETKELRVFDSKIGEKGKNSLGIFLSINGFSSGALSCFSTRTSFIAISGEDLNYVLEGRIRLDELLRAKKRHANETGNCMLETREWLVF